MIVFSIFLQNYSCGSAMAHSWVNMRYECDSSWLASNTPSASQTHFATQVLHNSEFISIWGVGYEKVCCQFIYVRCLHNFLEYLILIGLFSNAWQCGQIFFCGMTTKLQPCNKWDNVHSDGLNVLDCAHWNGKFFTFNFLSTICSLSFSLWRL